MDKFFVSEFNGTIWDRAICAAALRTQMSEAELHTRHKDSLGEDISTLTANDSLVPIMLIFTRGRDCRQTSGIGAGWDIVVPGGWGKSFWLLLQYFTARSVGLKDFEHLSLEMGQLSYPSNWPDTNGGAIAAKATHKEKLSVWLKRPPNKRVDYGKLRITSPFSFDWNLLLAEWMSVGQSDSTNFFVLREKWILMKLDDLCKPSTKPSAKNAAQTFFDSLTTTELDNCLVPVEIICHSKGRPKPLSIICIPTQSDLEKFKFPAKIRRCVQPMTNGISAIFEESLGARKKQSKTLQKTAEVSDSI